MKTRCIVVIGHVDHGKTSLVRALTGIETDRTAEEKARGLSILPGFAHQTYADGVLDFIDAPGHEDFIQAMISGASGAQAALLVVSAAEGVAAQTLEHLNIAGLLGITQGVIAVTKSDLLSPSQHSACLNALRIALSKTPLEDAPMILCSAQTKDGLDALNHALQSQLSYPPNTAVPLQTMLPIDRGFSLAGHGTIVTGTLLGKDLSVGGKAIVQPAGLDVTVRGLQSRGEERDHVHAGERVAVNLRGAAVSDIARGSVLCLDSAHLPSDCIDAEVQLVPSLQPPLKHMENVRVLFGTSNEVATVRLYGGGLFGSSRIEGAPTGLVKGLIQLRFAKPIIGFAGQRAILRRLSPAQTLGGATFLDTQATPTRSGDASRVRVLNAVQTGAPIKIATALCAAHRGAARLADVARLSRKIAPETYSALQNGFTDLGQGWIATAQDVEARKSDVLNALCAYHEKHPLHAGAPNNVTAFPAFSPHLLKHAETELCRELKTRRMGNILALCAHDPLALLSTAHKQRMDDIETRFRRAGLTSAPQPSEFSGTDTDLIALLIQAGRLSSLTNVSLKQTLLFHSKALSEAASTLRRAFPLPTPFTPSQARTALSTSRRIIVPVLEHFDTSGLTTSDGDTRQMCTALPVSPVIPT